MEVAAPGVAFLAGPDDETARRLVAALVPAGWLVRRDGPADGATVAVLFRHRDPAAFLTSWRAAPDTAGVPVLALGDDLPAGADALLPLDAPAAVLLCQLGLLARLARSERDRLAQRDRIQDVLDVAPVAISVKDPQGRYLLVNRCWEDAFVGKTLHDVFPADEADRLAAHYLAAVRGGGPVEYEEVAQQADGPHTFLKSKFVLRDGGEPWAVCGIATDVTPLKRAQQALR